jgi:hypothetical protein
MEILLLMSITGLVGLAASVGMLYASHQTRSDGPHSFGHQSRDDFFRRVKVNAGRLK